MNPTTKTEKLLPFVAHEKGQFYAPQEIMDRIVWADSFVPELTAYAREIGYGIATLGSMVRDIDLIAVPWEYPTAKPHLDFVMALVSKFDLLLGNHGQTVAGHRRYVLWHKDHRDHYIDLKVILPTGDAVLPRNYPRTPSAEAPRGDETHSSHQPLAEHGAVKLFTKDA